MKTWIKGGIIGLSILLIIAIINGMFPGEMTLLHSFFDNVYRALVAPIKMLFKSDEVGFNIFIYSLIFYFIIGALIGLIIKKVKSKKVGNNKK